MQKTLKDKLSKAVDCLISCLAIVTRLLFIDHTPDITAPKTW